MNGLNWAGFKQVAMAVDSDLLTATMAATTGDWVGFTIVSSDAQFTAITAPGMTGSSLISSGTTYPGNGAEWACSKITVIDMKGGKILAHKRVLI